MSQASYFEQFAGDTQKRIDPHIFSYFLNDLFYQLDDKDIPPIGKSFVSYVSSELWNVGYDIDDAMKIIDGNLYQSPGFIGNIDYSLKKEMIDRMKLILRPFTI